MIYYASSQQTHLTPLSPHTYGPSYAPLSRPLEPSLPLGIGPRTSRALGPAGDRPREPSAPGAQPLTTTKRNPRCLWVTSGEALISAEHWPPSTARGKPSDPGDRSPRDIGETRRGAHPSPGTSRSLRPRARSCLARPPPSEPRLGAGPAGGCRGRRAFLAPAAGRALPACLRDIPAGRPLRLRRRPPLT